MKEAVSARIAEMNPSVFARVTDKLAEEALEKRVNQLVSALGAYDNLQKDFYRIKKPDVQSYDENGNVTSSSYSKDAVTKMKEMKEKMDKIERAVKASFDETMIS